MVTHESRGGAVVAMVSVMDVWSLEAKEEKNSRYLSRSHTF